MDAVSSAAGQFGLWQARTVGVVGLIGVFGAWQMLAVSFLLPEQKFWCNDGCADNSSNCEIPQDGNLSQCTEWEFDRSVYPETVVSQFQLVCGREWWRSASQAIYMLGIMIGALGSGIMSDRWGRQRVTLMAGLGILVFGSSVAASPSMLVFTLLRFCTAVCSIACYTCGYVYCLELVDGRWATLVGIGLQFPWAAGYSSLPLLAWLLPTWSHLQLAISLPISLYCLALAAPRLVPESPRWLLVRGRNEQAKRILGQAASLNSLPSPDKIITPETESGSGSSLMDLFRTPGLRRTSLIMFYLWFTNSFVYYGLTLNSGSLIPGNLHLIFLVGGGLEAVAYILTIIAFLYLGRRVSTSACMLAGGAALLLTPVVTSTTSKAILAQFGKFAITGSFAMVYLYAAEVFPTAVRNAGVGSSSVWARVGGVIAPYIGRELGMYVVITANTSKKFSEFFPPFNSKLLKKYKLQQKRFLVDAMMLRSPKE